MLNKPSKLANLAPSMAQWGLLILIAIMPFHAFLSIFVGSLIGHQALIQAWKEFLIVIICILIAGFLLAKPKLRQPLFRPINLTIGAFILLSLGISLLNHNIGSKAFWYGAKTDLEFLILFVAAQLVSTKNLQRRLIVVILTTSAIVAGFACLQATILDKNFLNHFGYGTSTLAPYQLIDPALPNNIRVLGTLAGPNQLGSFLILPICLMLYLLIRKRWLLMLLPLLISSFALLHSYSRSAWIGTLLAIALTAVLSLSRKLGLAIAATGLMLLIVATSQRQSLFNKYPQLQYFILHSQSTGNLVKTSDQGHAESLQQGLRAVEQHPLGLGLGSAGPASFQSKATLITENYYLQLAVEVGVVGLLLFLLINWLLARDLFMHKTSSDLAIPCLSALAGIATTSLFLHAWTDSSTALIFWGTAGATIATLSSPKRVSHG